MGVFLYMCMCFKANMRITVSKEYNTTIYQPQLANTAFCWAVNPLLPCFYHKLSVSPWLEEVLPVNSLPPLGDILNKTPVLSYTLPFITCRHKRELVVK